MTVLVTGAGGFLGAHVVHALLRAGNTPRAMVRPGRPRVHLDAPGIEVVEGDLSDERSLVAACRGAKGLIHCAARLGSSPRQNEVQRKVNVEGTAALYRAAHKTGVARIVHVSSVAAVGGTRDGTLLDESATWNLRPLGVQYADTKRAGEERALAAAWGGMPIVVVNPAYILGHRCDGGPPSTMLRRIAAGQMRFVTSGGTSVTDVEDVARAILAALERGVVGQRYILAGHNVTWAALYAATAEVTGGRAPRVKLPPWLVATLAGATGALDKVGLARPPFTPQVWRACDWYGWFDSSKARRELDYDVRPLDVILRRTWATANALERVT